MGDQPMPPPPQPRGRRSSSVSDSDDNSNGVDPWGNPLSEDQFAPPVVMQAHAIPLSNGVVVESMPTADSGGGGQVLDARTTMTEPDNIVVVTSTTIAQAEIQSANIAPPDVVCAEARHIEWTAHGLRRYYRETRDQHRRRRDDRITQMRKRNKLYDCNVFWILLGVVLGFCFLSSTCYFGFVMVNLGYIGGRYDEFSVGLKESICRVSNFQFSSFPVTESTLTEEIVYFSENDEIKVGDCRFTLRFDIAVTPRINDHGIDSENRIISFSNAVVFKNVFGRPSDKSWCGSEDEEKIDLLEVWYGNHIIKKIWKDFDNNNAAKEVNWVKGEDVPCFAVDKTKLNVNDFYSHENEVSWIAVRTRLPLQYFTVYTVYSIQSLFTLFFKLTSDPNQIRRKLSKLFTLMACQK